MRHHLLSLSVAFTLACSGSSSNLDEGRSLDNRAGASSAKPSALLESVDADTIYVYASMEPLPEAVIAQAMGALQDGAKPLYEILDDAELEASHDPEARAIHAIASSLRDKLSMSGLRSIGIDLQQPFVIHAVGFLPVLRMRLVDPDGLRAFVEDTASKAGYELPRRSVGSQSFWAFPIEDILVVAVAIQGSDLVIALAPQKQPEPTLERALGLVPPQTSLAQSDRLERIRTTYRIATNMVGYIDFAGAWAYLGDGADSLASGQLRALMQRDAVGIPPECVTEGAQLVGHMPRLVMGYRSIDQRESRGFTALEVSESLGRQLAAMAVAHPWLEGQPSSYPLLGLSVGIDPGVVISSLAGLSERKWRCGPLREVSEELRKVTGQAFDPPFGSLAKGVTGVHLAIEDLVTGANGEAEIRGHAILEHRQLDSLVGVMSGMLGLPSVKDGAAPVAMPLPLPWGQQDLLVGRSGTSLILAMGKGSFERAKSRAGAPVSGTRPAITVAYDEARLYRLAETSPWLYEILDDDDDSELDDEASREQLRQVDAALASGFSYGAVWFRERAIEIESITMSASAGSKSAKSPDSSR